MNGKTALTNLVILGTSGISVLSNFSYWAAPVPYVKKDALYKTGGIRLVDLLGIVISFLMSSQETTP